MNIDKVIAKQICQELGIEWDNSATGPTLRGKNFDIEKLFRGDIDMLDDKHIDRLYVLLQKVEKKDPDSAAALRWAIFTLEQSISQSRQSGLDE